MAGALDLYDSQRRAEARARRTTAPVDTAQLSSGKTVPTDSEGSEAGEITKADVAQPTSNKQAKGPAQNKRAR